MLREHEVRADRLLEIRLALPARSFAAIDPGDAGAVLIYSPSRLLAIYPMAAAVACAKFCAETGVSLFVVETQYMGKNPQAVLRLARRASMLPTYVAALREAAGNRAPTSVLWVAPGTWQAPLRKRAGKQPDRVTGKLLALARAREILGGDGRFVGAGKQVQEGIADALGIAEWTRGALWSLPSIVQGEAAQR
jgi:hypothetical protein